MSLKISNLATAKQKAMLHKLDYYGTGSYSVDKLTIQQAAELLDELFEEQRLMQREGDYDEFNG